MSNHLIWLISERMDFSRHFNIRLGPCAFMRVTQAWDHMFGHSEVFQASGSFHEGWLNTIWGLFPVFSRMWTTLTQSPCLGPAWPRTKLNSSIANPHRVGRPVAKCWNASGEYGAIRAHMLPAAISETETVCRGSLCVCVCVDPQVQPAICVSLFATSLVPAAVLSRWSDSPH